VALDEKSKKSKFSSQKFANENRYRYDGVAQQPTPIGAEAASR
jgi:hypothetical protein